VGEYYDNLRKHVIFICPGMSNDVGDIKPHVGIAFFLYQYVGADTFTEKDIPLIPQQYDKAVETAELLRTSR